MVRTVNVELTGKMPLLMHADSIEWSDSMEVWKNNPDNKALSKAGDDRTPAWRWIGALNFDDPKTGKVTIPSEYIMRCLMAGGAEVPTGKGKKTFKAQSQSGILSQDFHWSFFINDGKTVPMAKISELLTVPLFHEHVKVVREMGFDLFVKRAKIGANKHIRVRPRFDRWSARGELIIVDETIDNAVLKNMLSIAGRLKGLGDWRPSAPQSPGPFGTFEAKIIS